MGLLLVAACAEAPIEALLEPDESSDESGSEDGKGKKDAAASDASSSEDDDDDDESSDDAVDQGGGGVQPRDAGAPRGAVNGGRDSGAAAVTRDSGSSTTTPATRTDAGSGSGTGRDSSITGTTDSGSATSGTARCGGAASDACTTCLCTQCAAEMEACYASGEATKDQQCAAIETCAEKNSCVSTDCYCGNSDLLCLAPAGLCLQEIQTAAGSTVTSDVTAARNDPQNPVSRANALTVCGDGNCRTQCGF